MTVSINNARKHDRYWIRSIVVASLFFFGLLAQSYAQTMAITFDDGFLPSSAGEQATKDNQNVLSTLKQHNVTSMLFPTGTALSGKNMNLVSTWSQAGHALGNHTFSHQALSATNTDQYIADIQKAQARLEPIKGWCPRLRFPYLDEGQTAEQHNQVMRWLGEHGYGVAGATIAVRDWEFDAQYQNVLKTQNRSKIRQFETEYLAHLMQEIQKQHMHWQSVVGRDPAHVLLLHTNQINTAVLDRLLHQIKGQGWTIVTPNTAFKDPIYQRGYTDSNPKSAEKTALPIPDC